MAQLGTLDLLVPVGHQPTSLAHGAEQRQVRPTFPATPAGSASADVVLKPISPQVAANSKA